MNWEQMKVGSRVCKPGMPESVHFDLMPFGFFLMIRADNPTNHLVWEINRAHTQFRCIMVDQQLVFLSRFGMQPWNRSFFHIAAAQRQTLPSPVLGSGMPIHILLVNGVNGVVMARRIDALSPELTRKLIELMREQDPQDPLLNRDIMIRRVTNTYTTIQLAAMAASSKKVKSSRPLDFF